MTTPSDDTTNMSALVAAAAEPKLDTTMTSLAESLHRQSSNMEAMQAMALQMGGMLNQLANGQMEIRQEQAELRAKMAADADALKKRMDALENSSAVMENATTVSAKAVDSSSTLRYALRFLMTAGMDTRTGLVCAFPMMRGPTCYVVISLHLLKFSFNRIFKTHTIKGHSMSNFSHAFLNVDAAASRDALETAQRVMPIVEDKSVSRRGCDTWAVMKASRFVQLCLDMETRYPVDDDRKWSTDHLWEVVDDEVTVKELDMPQRMKNTNTSADDYTKKDKIAWNVPVWRDILDSAAVKEYVRIVAEAKGEEMPVNACHFSGLDLFPTMTVEPHPRMPLPRRGKGYMMSAVATKQPRHFFRDETDSGGDEGKEESKGDEDEDEEEDEDDDEDKESKVKTKDVAPVVSRKRSAGGEGEELMGGKKTKKVRGNEQEKEKEDDLESILGDATEFTRTR